MIKINDEVKIYFNEHSRKALQERGKIEELKFSLYLGLETRPNSNFHIVKPFLRCGNDILPCRIFNDSNITYIKVLTFLDEYRFFISANMNFGTNYFIKDINKFEIINKESYFDKDKDPITNIKPDDIIWNYHVKKIDKIKGKFVSINDRDNLVLQKYGLPLLIKTFSNNFIALG